MQLLTQRTYTEGLIHTRFGAGGRGDSWEQPQIQAGTPSAQMVALPLSGHSLSGELRADWIPAHFPPGQAP